jgi:hypothetical protein
MAVTQRVGTRHCEAFYQIFVQALGSPAAKLGAAMGFDPLTNCDNDFKVIVLGAVLLAVDGSYQVFLFLVPTRCVLYL